jgi:hypothetical protein
MQCKTLRKSLLLIVVGCANTPNTPASISIGPGAFSDGYVYFIEPECRAPGTPVTLARYTVDGDLVVRATETLKAWRDVCELIVIRVSNEIRIELEYTAHTDCFRPSTT